MHNLIIWKKYIEIEILSHDFIQQRYMRDFEVETIGLKETSRRCSDSKCGARLRDTVLDWEVNLFTGLVAYFHQCKFFLIRLHQL